MLAKNRTRKSLAERLEAKLDKSGECWLWTGCFVTRGYGCIKASGKMVGAHRVAWELANGPVPDGLFVCHRCDTPACCNPAHLFLGTCADNNRDCHSKGRAACQKGQSNGFASISEADVREIRSRYAAGEQQKSLAFRFKVNQSQISRVVNWKRWGYLA